MGNHIKKGSRIFGYALMAALLQEKNARNFVWVLVSNFKTYIGTNSRRGFRIKTLTVKGKMIRAR